MHLFLCRTRLRSFISRTTVPGPAVDLFHQCVADNRIAVPVEEFSWTSVLARGSRVRAFLVHSLTMLSTH